VLTFALTHNPRLKAMEAEVRRADAAIQLATRRLCEDQGGCDGIADCRDVGNLDLTPCLA
jgi:hypothetical protein